MKLWNTVGKPKTHGFLAKAREIFNTKKNKGIYNSFHFPCSSPLSTSALSSDVRPWHSDVFCMAPLQNALSIAFQGTPRVFHTRDPQRKAPRKVKTWLTWLVENLGSLVFQWFSPVMFLCPRWYPLCCLRFILKSKGMELDNDGFHVNGIILSFHVKLQACFPNHLGKSAALESPFWVNHNI